MGDASRSNLTLASLLEQGCQKVYNRPPEKKNYETGDGQHGTILVVGPWRGDCVSRNRKTSQHLAARAVLLKIIDSGRFADFLIQGGSKEEARQFLMNLQPELGVDEDMARQNWPGKCDELCAQRKLPRKPIYTFSEVGAGLEKRFKCVSSMLHLRAEEEGSSKKKAKAAAARAMHELIFEQLKVETAESMDVVSAALRSAAAPAQDEDLATQTPCPAQGGFVDWLKAELQDRDVLEHCVHERCSGAEALLRRVLARAAQDQQMFLHKLWPGLQLKLSLDRPNLVELDEQGLDTDALQQKLDRDLFSAEVTVFLDVLSEGKTKNVFHGTAPTLRDARELACCSMLTFLKCYIDK